MCGQTITVDSKPVVTPSKADLAAMDAALVEKRNLAFRKAGKMRKRVILAKDVLALLNAKKLLARAGVYASLGVGKKTCTVCALGGMVEACFLRNGEEFQDDEESTSQGAILEKLSAFFDRETLNRVEMAFEQRVGVISFNDQEKLGGGIVCDNIRQWIPINSMGDSGRLRLIMANIINNHGEFRTDIPPTDKDYKVGGVVKS